MKPVRLRRISQIAFFLLFLFLLLRTELRGSLHASGSDMALAYPVRLFFQIDPLVAISNALATRSLYHGLLWSLIVLLPTLFLGRFFCGWICPMGSLNHFFSSLKSERKRGKQLIESNRYKPLANRKVLHPGGRAGGGRFRDGHRRMVRSSFAAGAFAGAVDSAGAELRADGGPARA